jgi:hypothetical protein
VLGGESEGDRREIYLWSFVLSCQALWRMRIPWIVCLSDTPSIDHKILWLYIGKVTTIENLSKKLELPCMDFVTVKVFV